MPNTSKTSKIEVKQNGINKIIETITKEVDTLTEQTRQQRSIGYQQIYQEGIQKGQINAYQHVIELLKKQYEEKSRN